MATAQAKDIPEVTKAAAAAATNGAKDVKEGAVAKLKAGATLDSKTSIEKLWAIGGDFLAVDKFIPNLKSCKLAEGKANEVGCVRRCTAKSVPGYGEDANLTFDEKILAVDKEKHYLQYALMGATFPGYKNYVGTFKIDPSPTPGNSLLSWTVEMDLPEGQNKEEVSKFLSMMYDNGLKSIEAVANGKPSLVS